MLKDIRDQNTLNLNITVYKPQITPDSTSCKKCIRMCFTLNHSYMYLYNLVSEIRDVHYVMKTRLFF